MNKYIIILTILMLNISCQNNSIKNKKINVIGQIQNEQNNIFYGETIYPDQIKNTIKHYNKKYNINIQYAQDKQDFLQLLSKTAINDKPKTFFQYNSGHKYGFIFIKYNNRDYCICVDTIPTLSEYYKDLNVENGNLYIKFNNRKYKTIIFGENLQKAQKGCGSFTLVLLKHLLKNNAEFLLDVIKLENKYGIGDKTKRDVNKKSCIRGVDFDIIKTQNFAPEIYKYAQSMELQKEFDNRKLKNGKIFKLYRNEFSHIKKNKNGKNTTISTKIFEVTQKHKNKNIM